MQRIARSGESGGDSGAQPQHPQSQRSTLVSQPPYGAIDAASRTEIGSSDAALRVLLQLRTVVDGAVHQHALGGHSVIVFCIVTHVHNAIEISHGAKITAVLFHRHEAQEASEGNR